MDIEKIYADSFLHYQNGALDQAMRLCKLALSADPLHGDSWHLLGVIAYQIGRHDLAVDLMTQAIEINPAAAPYHSNLGAALRGLGRLDEAVACYRRAIEIQQSSYDAHYNLGNALKNLGRLDEAVACYRRAIEIKPDAPEAHNNLGDALRIQRRLDEAVASCLKAICLKPNYPQAHNNLGNALQEQGRLDEAVASYRQALELEPDHLETYTNLGPILYAQGRLDEAALCYRTALAHQPDYANALDLLLCQLQECCQWEEIATREEQVLGIVRQNRSGIRPFSLLAVPATAADQLACVRTFSKNYAIASSAAATPRPRPPAERIRIGYLSADFHNHATAHLIAELFERHDRTRFVVMGYSFGPDDGGAMRRRLIEGLDRFVDMHPLPYQEAAEQIRRDGIDILVDLKGYTKDARTQILASRPAPVQVNFLGYPGTMGADFIDYIIADHFCLPPKHEAFYSEKIVRLPGCYQPNDTKRAIAERMPSRTECGLPETGFVFCSFNASFKITPTFFDIWMRLLNAVPGAVLWLLEANAWVKANLRREAAARGVDPARLVFAPRLPAPEHLARHRLADLFLDSLPCNAHTTASDALWAGLPVLTCAGHTFAGRVAGSLLTAFGVPELITESVPDYEASALELATHPAALAALRAKIQDHKASAPLFDIKTYTRNIEAAYARMYLISCAGQPAKSFDIRT